MLKGSMRRTYKHRTKGFGVERDPTRQSKEGVVRLSSFSVPPSCPTLVLTPIRIFIRLWLYPKSSEHWTFGDVLVTHITPLHTSLLGTTIVWWYSWHSENPFLSDRAINNYVHTTYYSMYLVINE